MPEYKLSIDAQPLNRNHCEVEEMKNDRFRLFHRNSLIKKGPLIILCFHYLTKQTRIFSHFLSFVVFMLFVLIPLEHKKRRKKIVRLVNEQKKGNFSPTCCHINEISERLNTCFLSRVEGFNATCVTSCLLTSWLFIKWSLCDRKLHLKRVSKTIKRN